MKTQKEQRDKFESAVIKVIESAVSVSSDTLCDDSQNGTQTVGNNFASTDPAEPISTDHTLYSMHTFIATLSLFMKDTLAESRSVVASPPGKRTMFENVGLITNINDAIHKAVHKLEEMERDSYDMGSTDRHVEGVKHDRLNLFQTLSTMLRKLIDSTSNALLGATGSPSKDKQNIYNIMDKHDSERQTPCIGTGKCFSLTHTLLIIYACFSN